MGHRGLHDAEVCDLRGGTVRGQFDAQGPAELLDTGLADHVWRSPGSRGKRCGRGHHDHMPLARDDVFDPCPHRVVHAGQIDADNAIEIGIVHHPHGGRGRRDPRIRDNDIQPAEPLDSTIDRVPQRRAITHIRCHSHCARTDRLRGGLDRTAVYIHQHHRSTPLVQQASHLEADPLRGSGHQRSPAGNAERCRARQKGNHDSSSRTGADRRITW